MENFIKGTNNLINHLHQISIILMNAEPGSIIRFEYAVDEFKRSDLKQELFELEKSSIGG